VAGIDDGDRAQPVTSNIAHSALNGHETACCILHPPVEDATTAPITETVNCSGGLCSGVPALSRSPLLRRASPARLPGRVAQAPWIRTRSGTFPARVFLRAQGDEPDHVLPLLASPVN
jgi:hypothetical protein